MTLRTSPRTAPPAHSPAPIDPALDEALEHIGALSERLWAVRRLHAPSRSWRGRVRCAGCGQALPCPTLRAAAPGRR